MFQSNDTAQAQYIRTLETHSSPQAFNVMAGDFNFVHTHTDRMNYDIDAPPTFPDAKTYSRWGDAFGGYFDTSQETAMTYFGVDHAARLDRVYVKLALLPSSLYKVRSWVCPGFRQLSDHVPVSVRISIKQPPSDKRVPASVIKHPLFETKVTDFYDQMNTQGTTAWHRLACLKKAMSCKAVFWGPIKNIRKYA